MADIDINSYDIIVETLSNNVISPKLIFVKLDSASVLNFKFQRGSNVIDVTNMVATIQIIRPGNSPGVYGDIVAKDGIFRWEVPPGAINIKGNYTATISIYDNGRRYTSANFKYMVRESLDLLDITKDPDYPILTQLIAETQNVKDLTEDNYQKALALSATNANLQIIDNTSKIGGLTSDIVNILASEQTMRSDITAIQSNSQALKADIDKIKLSGVVSNKSVCVDELGAKGDNITDDTKAIQDAVLYCMDNGIQNLTFSQGKTYLLNAPIDSEYKEIIIYHNDLHIFGNNATLHVRTATTGHFGAIVNIFGLTNNGSSLTFPRVGNYTSETSIAANNIIIEKLSMSFDSDVSYSNIINGFAVSNARDCKIIDCKVYKCPQTAFAIVSDTKGSQIVENVQVIRCEAYDSKNHAFRATSLWSGYSFSAKFEDCKSMRMLGTTTTDSGDRYAHFIANDSSKGQVPYTLEVKGCEFDNTGEVHMQYVTNTVVRNNKFYGGLEMYGAGVTGKSPNIVSGNIFSEGVARTNIGNDKTPVWLESMQNLTFDVNSFNAKNTTTTTWFNTKCYSLNNCRIINNDNIAIFFSNRGGGLNNNINLSGNTFRMPDIYATRAQTTPLEGAVDLHHSRFMRFTNNKFFDKLIVYPDDNVSGIDVCNNYFKPAYGLMDSVVGCAGDTTTLNGSVIRDNLLDDYLSLNTTREFVSSSNRGTTSSITNNRIIKADGSFTISS